jgi:hypothetical protein
MRELLVLLFIVAVIAIIWYLRQQSAAANEQRKVDEFRRLQAKANESERATPVAGRGTGLLQEAADRATGKPYEAATDRIETLTADLAAARQDADVAARRLAGQASEALASIETAAAAPEGAVPGDGGANCPAGYPIKGNTPSMRYHTPDQPSYAATIPEVCFESAAAAVAAGFTEYGAEPAMP